MVKLFFLFVFFLSFGWFSYFFFYLFFLFSFLVFLVSFYDFSFGGVFFCDSLSFSLLLLTFFIYACCFFTSLLDKWVSNGFFSFSFFLSFIYFLLFVSFSVFSFVLFYVCFEVIFMLMFLFLLSWGYSPERLQASFYMVFYTIVVSLPFLFYLLFFWSDVFFCKFLFFGYYFSYWWAFFVFVFLVKLPVYGVHLWLPKAHVEAPVTGSMVLAGVLLKLGGYGFLRFSPLVAEGLYLSSGFLFSVGLLGGFVSCFLCLRQCDMKSFVAYSSVCHMGFGLVGLYSFSFFGMSGGVYMLLSHGYCSSCLFYVLYLIYERVFSRSLFVLKGLLFVFPVFSYFLFFSSVFNMGVPPSFSFFSEVFILMGLFGSSFSSVFLVVFLLFFTGCYGIFFFTILVHGNSSDSSFYSFTQREYLNMGFHLFPIVYFPFFLDFLFS